MTKLQDQNRLCEVAKRLVKELKSQVPESQLSYRPHYQLSDLISVDTDGWYIPIALLPGPFEIELWLDRFRNTQGRFFWTGFVSRSANKISRMIEFAPSHLKPGRRYTDKDIDYMKNGNSVLRKPPSDVDMMRPIYERFTGDRLSFFGLYDRREHGHYDHFRSANFIREVVDAQDEEESLSRTEGGKRHLQIELRIRNHDIARQRKQKDDYRCQVCGFHFEERYGERGKALAEAHHKVPLSKLKKETKTTVKDLLTVCANCHRMLHRLGANGERDIVLLRKLRFEHNQAIRVTGQD